jgi:hypothetical protein
MNETVPRTPLWQMTDDQLRFLAEDELTQWDRRITAQMILDHRNEMPDGVRRGETEDDGA